MNLHRTTGRPDWANITPANRNAWQRLAMVSRGWLTPGNVFTLSGLFIVIIGLYWLMSAYYWLALYALIVGRCFDLLDGWAAEVTGTKSPLGEILDAVSDKIGTLLTLGAACLIPVAPWWLLLGLALPHLIIAAISYAANRRGRRLHPSRLGKISMAAAWIGLLGLIALQATSMPSITIGLTVYILCGLSIGMGLAAASGYFKALKLHG